MFDKKTFGKYIANFKLALILTEVLPYKAEQGDKQGNLIFITGKRFTVHYNVGIKSESLLFKLQVILK